MKRFSHSDIWHRILIEDYCADISLFVYESDIDVPRVIVSETPEIKVLTLGDHTNIIPFEFESYDQFHSLAIQALAKAHELAGKTFYSIREARIYIDTDMDCGTVNIVLYSLEDFKKDIDIEDKIKSKLGYDVFTAPIKEINKNEFWVLPSMEFLGVISERTLNGKELHGIGIINSRAIVKVILKDN